MSAFPHDFPIVDAHHHLWDLGQLPYPWLAPNSPPARFGDKASIQRDYLPEHYLSDFDGLNLVGSVHVQANCGADDVVAETQWLQGLSESTQFPSAIVAEADLSQPDALELIKRHAKFPLTRGIRTPVAWDKAGRWRVARQPNILADSRFLEAAQLLCDLDLVLEMVVVPEQLPEVVALAENMPNLRIALNHFAHPEPDQQGNVETWFDGVTRLAPCQNVYMKLSGLWTIDRQWAPTSIKPFIDHAIRNFTSERLMYGSNLPVESVNCSIAGQLRSLMTTLGNHPPVDLHNVFSGTAHKFYKLDL